MAKVIKFMSKEEMFQKCLEEAWELYEGNFNPELDNLESQTIASILFKVLTEWDLAIEGHTIVPAKQLKKAERFLSKWKKHIQKEDESDRKMYVNF
ncbi:hypothetical protein [Bacillus paralicheniformis]|uniref:hypothetical protein n=1 Tax=Bacillus paralicheniformis TaxID=1648923 RepID=UPI001FD68F6E|nr:hypothetical protein [Bacillus paralicheniformis]MCJ8223728.1 hypothetical protein [Bacillus paralicheniformis]